MKTRSIINSTPEPRAAWNKNKQVEGARDDQDGTRNRPPIVLERLEKWKTLGPRFRQAHGGYSASRAASRQRIICFRRGNVSDQH